MESHSVDGTPQASNCTTFSHDANYQIPLLTDNTDDGIKNVFLLNIGTNTNMSSNLQELYTDEEMNIDEYRIQLYEALDLQMLKKYEHDAHDDDMNTEYISEYLNINPLQMNEWTMYKTATETINMNLNMMNIASHSLSLNENETEYEYKGKNEKCIQMKNMGNYNDEIYGSIKRALEDRKDVFDTLLQIEYGLFEDPLQTINIMYLIENDIIAIQKDNKMR